MLEEASMVGKIRGKITLVLLAALLACVLPFTLSAQGENNLNGYNLNGELLTAGTSESDEALFSGNRIFAQNQTGLQANFGSGYSTQQTVPNLAAQQSILRTTGLADEIGGPYVVCWSNPDLIVRVNDEPATNGETKVQKGSKIEFTINPTSGKTVTSCVVGYKIWRLKVSPDVYEEEYFPYDLTYQGGPYRTTIEDELRSNVTITVEVQTSYPLWVAGEVVTDSNRNDIGERGGTISFNPERNILFLNNAVIEGSIVSKMPLTILFAGDNVISGKVGTGYGISSSENLSISASSSADTLTVTAPVADKSCAIAVENAGLTIWNGTNVTAISQGGTEMSAAVFASGTVEVNGNLSAAGGSAAESYGIYCNNLTVKNINSAGGGSVVAYGGDCYSGGNSTGVRSAGDITVEYLAALTAAGRGASGSSRGVWANGNFVNNGTADCSSGNGGSDSVGLFAEGSVSNAGMLSAKGGTSSGGASCGIASKQLLMTGGSLDAHAVSGVKGSTGIFSSTTISGGEIIAEGAGGAFSAMPSFSGYSPLIRVSDLNSDAFEADSTVASNYLRKYVFITSRILSSAPTELTIYVGETRTLSASVPDGYSLRWSGSNNMVAWVDEMLGTVTGRSPGTLMATVRVYDPYGIQTSQASCMVTVKANETVPVTAIQLDQDNVTLTAIPGLRTVKYWFYPTNATDKEVTFECKDETRSIIRLDVSPENQEFYITPVANGSTMIILTAKSGAKAYCKVTVNGIGTKVSYAISYMDNDGVWYYDWSGDFLVKTTAPASELPGIEIDGVSIPQTAGAQRNWSYTSADGGTAIVFTRQFMSSLYWGKHTLAVSYSATGRITRTFTVQSVRDAPRTGDRPFVPVLVMFALSGIFAVGTGAAVLSGKKQKRRTGSRQK